MSPPKVGFVGAGSVLWAYLQMLDRMLPRGLAVEGPICARRRETWPSLLARRPRAQLVATPAEVVESDVDVVVVITPAATHGELTRLALEHDKHVLVEKPFAAGVDEGRALLRLARSRGLHLMAAPFVHLAPTFRALWTQLHDGAIGRVHSARAMYGIPAPSWNTWMYGLEAGPLGDLGVYNLKSLTALLGPVVEVVAAHALHDEPLPASAPALSERAPDVVHATLRHASGALASVMAAWEVQQYRRTAIEVYGVEGTADLLGDDWDPRGHELWTVDTRCWRTYDSLDPTWLWTDGLRELVAAVRERRPPLHAPDQDVHLIEVLDACRRAGETRAAVTVGSRFEPPDLRLELDESTLQHLHDHTRSPEDQH